MDTKEKILKAAGPIFAEKGRDAATIRDICEAAGVNLASVNYHFGDKDNLYRETIRYAHELRLKQVPVRPFPPDLTPEQGLRLFVETMLRRMLKAEEEPWQGQLMQRELFAPTGACAALVEDYIRPQVRLLLGILEPLLPAELPEEKRYKVVFSVVGQCLHYKAAWPVVRMLLPAETVVEHFSVEELAEHIAGFTLSACAGLRGAGGEAPIARSGKNRPPADAVSFSPD